MALNAQAGPSRNRTLAAKTDVIDLTFDSGDEDISLPPPIRKQPTPNRRESTTLRLNGGSGSVNPSMPQLPGQLLARRKSGEGEGSAGPKADKGKQVDRGRTSLAENPDRLDETPTTNGFTKPDHDPNQSRSTLATRINASNAFKRSQTTAHPSLARPSAQDRRTDRNFIPAASTASFSNQKPGRGRDLTLSTSPQKHARNIAGSSRVASHLKGINSATTSKIDSFFRPSNAQPVAGPSESGKLNTNLDPQASSKFIQKANSLTRIISNEPDSTIDTVGTYNQKRNSQLSSFVAPKASGKSVSPIKASGSMEERGLVPGPKEKGKQKELMPERGRTEKREEDRGVKRNRSAAFDSTSKPDLRPGAKVGRNRDLGSSAEVTRMFSPGKVPATHGRARGLQRTDSMGGTPTPSARPLPPVFGASGHVRHKSPLKESTSSRNLASRQPVPIPSTHRDPPSTPSRPSASPEKPSHSTLKQTTLPCSPRAQLNSETSARHHKLINPSPDKDLRNAVTEESKDTTYKTHRRRRPQAEEGEEEDEEEENIPSRPKRARPPTGTYTVPGMDDPKWPTRNGSSGHETGARRRQRKSAAVRAKVEAANLSTQIANGAKVDNSDNHTVISINSTVVSVSPEKQDRSHLYSSREAPRDQNTSSASDLAGPSKTVPTTPQTRHQRLSSRTPRTLSKQSIQSHISRSKTPSRRERPSFLAPQTPHDGPDEMEEPIENIPPTPDETSQPVEDDDVLAMFAEYNFAPVSPEQSMTSLKDGTPKTPKSNAAPSTPKSTAKKPVTTPGSRTVLAETTDPNTTPSAHRVLTAFKSPLHGLSPKVIRNITNSGSRNLVAEIMAKDEAEKARKLERDAKREERKRQLEAIMEDNSYAELQDISAIELSIAPDQVNDTEDDTPEDSIASRRANRSRTSSNPTPKSKSKTSRTLIPEIVISKKLPQTAADLFFKEQRKATPGSRVGDADTILSAISRSISPQKPDVSKSEDSESEDEDGPISKKLRLDLLEDNEDISGLLDMAREVKGSKRDTAPVECEVFWSKEPVKQPTSIKTASVSTELLDFCAEVPAGLHSTVISALGDTFNKSMFVESLTETDANKQSILLANLTHTISTSVGDGDLSSFSNSVCSIWDALGARLPAGLDFGTPAFPEGIFLDREEASSLICEWIRLRIESEGRFGQVDVDCVRKFIPLLLLQAVDPQTSPALRRTIDDTLVALWTESAFMDNVLTRRVSFVTDGAIPIAMDILRHTDSLPMFIKTQVLLAVGQTTFESRSVNRWYAAGILLPGSLKGLDQVTELQTPSIDTIIEGAERILDTVNSPSPDFNLIDNLTTCLYATLSDIDLLVTTTPYNNNDTEDNHPIMDLRALLIKIHHSMKSPGDDELKLQVSHTKARLAQLAIILEMQFETAFRRMKREKARAKLGKGLKEGKDGQAMLAFSRDVTMSASVERGV